MEYRPKPENRRAFGALDDHGRAYVVLEPLIDDPRLQLEAYQLSDGATLAKAEEIAAQFNETSSFLLHGPPPLIGDEVPRLHRAKE
jgi:hypothetical protein